MKWLASILRTIGQVTLFCLILTVTAWRWGLLPAVTWGAVLDVGLAIASAALLISFVRTMVTSPERRRRDALVKRLEAIQQAKIAGRRKDGKA